MGMSAQDRRGAERLASRCRSSDRGFLLDLMNQVESAGSPDVFRKVLPTGEGREVQRLDARVSEPVEGLSPIAGGVLLGAIEPIAGQILALDQGPGDVNSRPILGPFDKALLDAIREQVF